MKKLIVILAAVIAVMSCNETDNKAESTNSAATTATTAEQSNAANTSNIQAQEAGSNQITKIEWLNGTDLNLKAIKEGESTDAVFRFKNTGDKPLIISAVNPACGCTVAEKPTKPIAPGETSEIKAAFNSNGQGTGTKSKKLDVIANTDPQMTTLNFHVEVKPKS